MNTASGLNSTNNGSDNVLFSAEPPPMAVRDWPWCSYALPLPPESNYAVAARWIWSIVPAMWIIIGTIGNLLSGIVIFRRYRKFSSTAVYLLTLAVTDTVFLYNEPLKHLAHNVFGIDIRNYGDVCCKILSFMTFSSFHISAWILVVVTAERVVSMTWPYKVKTLATERNALIVVCCVVALVFAVDSHLLYGFEIRKNTDLTNKTECFAAFGAYSSFYIHEWFWIHLAFGFSFPFLSLIIGNTVVIFGLRNMHTRQKQLHASTISPLPRVKVSKQCSSNQRPRTTRTTRSLTIMLLLLNTIFFISQAPLAVYSVYLPYVENYLNTVACNNIVEYMAGAEQLHFWTSLVHSFAYMNASINFVLYVISGSQFRRELSALLACNARVGKMELNSQSNTSGVQENPLLKKKCDKQQLSTIHYTTNSATSARGDQPSDPNNIVESRHKIHTNTC